MERTRFHGEDLLKNLPAKENIKLEEIVLKIEIRLVNIKRDLFEIGKALRLAKEIVPHGAFQTWIEKSFKHELPYSTAVSYMRIYETFSDAPKRVQMLPVTFLMSMTEKGFPAEVVRLIEDCDEYVDKIDIRAVNEAYTQYKLKTITLDQFTKLAENYIKLGIDIWKGRTEQRLSTNSRRTLKNIADEVLRIIKQARKSAQGMLWLYPPVERSKQEMQLRKAIDEMIEELERMKKDLAGVGLFRPMVRRNPVIGKEYDSQPEKQIG